jgi:Spy/CpxP family protein refolding chaperone
MRTPLAVVVMIVGVAVYAALPAAADEKADQQTTTVLAERFQDLNLTDEQEDKIAEVRKEYRPKVQEEAKERATLIKEEVDKIRAVLTDEQRTKLAELKEERQERRESRPERLTERIAHLHELDLTDAEMAKIAEIRKEYHPRIAKAMESLKGILTDDQRKAREDALKANKKRREVMAALNLTDDQKAKVMAVGKEVRVLVHEELEKMRDVLTEGQREKLQELKDERLEHVRDRMACRIANFKDLNLTDQQKAQIADIRQEFRPKVHQAGNKLRGTVKEEVEAILAVMKA